MTILETVGSKACISVNLERVIRECCDCTVIITVDSHSQTVNPRIVDEMLLQIKALADKYDHEVRVYYPALVRGKAVICDTYFFPF